MTYSRLVYTDGEIIIINLDSMYDSYPSFFSYEIIGIFFYFAAIAIEYDKHY